MKPLVASGRTDPIAPTMPSQAIENKGAEIGPFCHASLRIAWKGPFEGGKGWGRAFRRAVAPFRYVDSVNGATLASDHLEQQLGNLNMSFGIQGRTSIIEQVSARSQFLTYRLMYYHLWDRILDACHSEGRQ